MSWFNFGEHKLWIINTRSKIPLYTWESWKQIMPSVEVFLNFEVHEAYIRTFQSFEFENRWLGFGRMKWSEENNIKWTTKYRTPENQNKLQFNSTEVWAPDWNTVYKNVPSPSVYIKLYHHDSLDEIRQGIIISVPEKTARRNQEKIDKELMRLLSIVPDSTLSTTTRPWSPWFRQLNHIEDMNPQELHKIVYGTELQSIARD